MELSPQAISSVEFDLVRRGYDPEQVRQFLTRLAAAIEEMRSHLVASDARARAAMARVQELSIVQPTGATSGEAEAITKALMLAQRTADQTVAAAEVEAADKVRAAEEQAAVIVRNAEVSSSEILSKADTEGRKRIEAELATLSAKRNALQTESDILRGQVAVMRNEIGDVIEELQRVLRSTRRSAGSRGAFEDASSFDEAVDAIEPSGFVVERSFAVADDDDQDDFSGIPVGPAVGFAAEIEENDGWPVVASTNGTVGGMTASSPLPPPPFTLPSD